MPERKQERGSSTRPSLDEVDLTADRVTELTRQARASKEIKPATKDRRQ